MKKLSLLLLCLLATMLLCSCASNQDAYKAGYEAGLAAAQAVATPRPTPMSIPTIIPSSVMPYLKTFAAQSSSDDNDVAYILNKNTKKFHYPDCSSVYDMKESNKIYFSGTRDEAISQGYVPCKRCNP